MTKSPLRYPGGKSKALKYITQYFPDMSRVKEYREPFLGGGSVALHIAKNYPDIDVWVNDLYEPLYNFWCVLRDHPDYLVNSLLDLRDVFSDIPSAKGLYFEARDLIHNMSVDPKDRAVLFFCVNKLSFSGLTEASGFSNKALNHNFTFQNIGRLKEYSKLIQNWKITNLPYEDLFCDDRSVFLYLDPPYDIKSDNLYGSKGRLHKLFDHNWFVANTDVYACLQLISYNTDMESCSQYIGWGEIGRAHV